MKRFADTRRLSDIDWSAWSPVDLATLLFVVHPDEVLLIRKKRGLGAGKINAPGGRIHAGETPLQAAVREVREEVGVRPCGIDESGQLRFQFTDGYSIRVWVFRATGCEGDAVETEEALPLWTPIAALPYEEMWEDDRHWVPLLLQRRPFDGRFLFDGDVMLDFHIELPEPTSTR